MDENQQRKHFSQNTKEKRLAFANEQLNLDWKQIMFTDKVKFEISAHGMNWVRRPPGSRYDPRYIREVNRQGRCSVMVWGAITYNRLLDICLLYTSPSPRDYAASRMPSSA